MFSAVPSMTVVEHLVSSRPPFELDDEDGLHLGTIARDRPRVYAVNGHFFGKEVKLVHGPSTVDRDDGRNGILSEAKRDTV